MFLETQRQNNVDAAMAVHRRYFDVACTLQNSNGIQSGNIPFYIG